MKRNQGPRRTGKLKPSRLSQGRYEGLKPDPEAVRAWIRKSNDTSRKRVRGSTPKEARDAAMARSKGRCIVCERPDSSSWPLQPHHVFPVRGPLTSFPELEGEPANIVMVCPGCHDAHERAMPRIPRGKLPQETRALAITNTERELYLEKTYPLGTDKR